MNDSQRLNTVPSGYRLRELARTNGNVAARLSDLVTPKQIGRIKQAFGSFENAGKVCRAIFECEINYLSKRAAERFIAAAAASEESETA